MLQVASALHGFAIEAKDGELGTVSDFLFDDSTWKVRWLVVDTGKWLTGRKVLIHPSAVGSADYGSRELTVALTKAQVKGSPDILQDRPVSQQMQNDLYNYYGWDPLWLGGMSGGLYGGAMGGMAEPLPAKVYFGPGAVRDAGHDDIDVDDGDPHLRSVTEVTNYHVHASDGSIGHVEDFLVESTSWSVRYLVINTSDWWVGKHVLMSPYAVKEVDVLGQYIRLDIARAKIRSGPSWNPADVISGEFERRMHSHYDWPGYGW
jgi:uncharacterized protein YrrD